MAKRQHTKIISKGVEHWNEWRLNRPDFRPNLIGLDLSQRNLTGINLSDAILRGAQFNESILVNANFKNADATGANFKQANLKKADFTSATIARASLRGAILEGSRLYRANAFRCQMRRARLKRTSFYNANMKHANLSETTIIQSNFDGAILREAVFTRAILIDVHLNSADVSGSQVYGIAAWDLHTDEHTRMDSLIVTKENFPPVTVDDLRVAQLVYLMLSSATLRNIVNTMATKMVLVLGSFAKPRKSVLEALKLELRRRNYIPVIFDFAIGSTRTFTETVICLAHLSKFIIADITDARSVPQELMAVVPHLPSVPVQPIILESQSEWGMFESFRPYPWVLKLQRYSTFDYLIGSLSELILTPVEEWLARNSGNLV
jgi:uncharacterized protein YjbI with pentapeptide repeats